MLTIMTMKKPPPASMPTGDSSQACPTFSRKEKATPSPERTNAPTSQCNSSQRFQPNPRGQRLFGITSASNSQPLGNTTSCQNFSQKKKDPYIMQQWKLPSFSAAYPNKVRRQNPSPTQWEKLFHQAIKECFPPAKANCQFLVNLMMDLCFHHQTLSSFSNISNNNQRPLTSQQAIMTSFGLQPSPSADQTTRNLLQPYLPTQRTQLPPIKTQSNNRNLSHPLLWKTPKNPYQPGKQPPGHPLEFHQEDSGNIMIWKFLLTLATLGNPIHSSVSWTDEHTDALKQLSKIHWIQWISKIDLNALISNGLF